MSSKAKRPTASNVTLTPVQIFNGIAKMIAAHEDTIPHLNHLDVRTMMHDELRKLMPSIIDVVKRELAGEAIVTGGPPEGRRLVLLPHELER